MQMHRVSGCNIEINDWIESSVAPLLKECVLCTQSTLAADRADKPICTHLWTKIILFSLTCSLTLGLCVNFRIP